MLQPDFWVEHPLRYDKQGHTKKDRSGLVRLDVECRGKPDQLKQIMQSMDWS
jgi:hypothetical protein